MKDIMFRKVCDPGNGTKSISVSSHTEDKESDTLIKKSFLYHVRPAEAVDQTITPPEVYIRKTLDTKQAIETFHFQVVGCFYVTHNRMPMRVDFHHNLNIQIKWKSKVFSPKKSVALT